VTGAIEGLGRISRALLLAGTAALAIMMLATTADVVLRATMNRPIRGIVDAVEIAMLLVVFLGLPDAFLRGEQIAVDIVDHLVPGRALAVLKALGAALSTLFLALIAINLVQPLLDAYRFGDRKADLPVPLYPLVALVIVCIATSFLTMMLVTVREVLRAVAAFRARPPEARRGVHP
jgi:TRAP-type C4-dicarboxylate transport system permease small subunit